MLEYFKKRSGGVFPMAVMLNLDELDYGRADTNLKACTHFLRQLKMVTSRLDVFVTLSPRGDGMYELQLFSRVDALTSDHTPIYFEKDGLSREAHIILELSHRGLDAHRVVQDEGVSLYIARGAVGVNFYLLDFAAGADKRRLKIAASLVSRYAG